MSFRIVGFRELTLFEQRNWYCLYEDVGTYLYGNWHHSYSFCLKELALLKLFVLWSWKDLHEGANTISTVPDPDFECEDEEMKVTFDRAGHPDILPQHLSLAYTNYTGPCSFQPFQIVGGVTVTVAYDECGVTVRVRLQLGRAIWVVLV